MKVAVISGEGTQSGKSTFVSILASVFAKTQQRKVAIFSTGDLDPLFKMNEVTESKSIGKSVSVYNALLRSASIKADDLYDYAYRVGAEEVYGFNIFSTAMAKADLEQLFMETIEKVRADLVIIEVKGSVYEEFNAKVIDAADAILYVHGVDGKSIASVLDYANNYENRKAVIRTGYVCQRYDRNVIPEKKLSKLIGVSVSNIMQVPYNSAVAKLGLEGELNKVAKAVAEGNSTVTNLRIKMLEIMQYLFDNGTHKYIRGFNEWRT